MAKKSKNTIDLYGWRELIQEIERLGGNIETACEEAILQSGKNATNRYKKFIDEHHYSGLTEKSVVDDLKVERQGSKMILQTGFDVKKGGAPAIWLDRGRPNQKALKYIQKIKKDDAVKGTIGYMLGQVWRGINK